VDGAPEFPPWCESRGRPELWLTRCGSSRLGVDVILCPWCAPRRCGCFTTIEPSPRFLKRPWPTLNSLCPIPEFRAGFGWSGAFRSGPKVSTFAPPAHFPADEVRPRSNFCRGLRQRKRREKRKKKSNDCRPEGRLSPCCRRCRENPSSRAAQAFSGLTRTNVARCRIANASLISIGGVVGAAAHVERSRSTGCAGPRIDGGPRHVGYSPPGTPPALELGRAPRRPNAAPAVVGFGRGAR